MKTLKNDMPTGSGSIITDYSTYCAGDLEHSLNKRIHVVIDGTKDYIVYLDDKFFIQWSMTKEYENKLPEGFGKIASMTGHLETISMALLKPNTNNCEAFRRLLAEAMARILGGNGVLEAENSIRTAKDFLDARSLERARVWYFLASVLVAVIASISVILLWIFREKVRVITGVNAFDVILGAFLGGVGAFTSMKYRLQSIKVDASSGPVVHFIEGGTRVVIGRRIQVRSATT